MSTVAEIKAAIATLTSEEREEIAAEAALLYPGASDEALAAGLVRLIEEPDLRDALRAKGFKRAEELSWTQTARETLEVLRAVSESA